jgi:hypothetical protein
MTTRATSQPLSQTEQDLVRRGEVLTVELYYPRVDAIARVTEVEVGLIDVRAADSVRISYDFDRDGWVIKQAAVFEWDADDQICDAEWEEVAFIQAWGRLRLPPPRRDQT